MPQRLRIFVSSPADVPNERLRADLIVDKLAQDYGRFFAIESYRWEHEAMLASAHFQDAIEPPSAFDIVVLILWSRLGTPLPEKTVEREYRGIDGRVPVTGTEWEYEEALKVAREKKAPDLLAFRNISPAPIDPRNAGAQAASIAQLGALNEFWARHFADRGVFLAAYDEYRTLEEFAQRLEESLRKLIERRIKDLSGGGTASTEAVWTGDPFRGLESYEFEHAPIFFGRDAAVTKATEQLAANARSNHAFLLVSGASGSGKSSLVKAGIVPRLMKPQRISGVAFLRVAVFRPGSEGADVILGLAKALTCAGNDNVGLPELIGPRQDVGQLAAYLRSATSNPDYLFANALGRLTDAARKSGRLLAFEEAKLILVVDQLEELFTAPGIGVEERRLFVELLAGLARSGTIWVIATLRADFWHRAADIPDLVALAEGQGRIDLAAPSPAELAEMIRRPAQAAGLSFEAHAGSGLGLDAVLAEHAAAAPGALPLLSFTLDELYRTAKARASTVLAHASYEALGGLEGAIANRADEIMAGLSAPAQAALPQVLRALTTVTGTTDQAAVARSAPLDSFAERSSARTLIDSFIAARLLVAASEGGALATVRLAHEALISRWQRARDQLAVDRRDLETRARLEQDFGRWSRARGRARRLLLLRNPDLANAMDLTRRWSDELDLGLLAYVQSSARRARLAQTLTAAAAALFAIIAGWAIYSERQAVTETYQASARQIGVLSELATGEALRGNFDTSLELGAHAVQLALDLDPNGNVVAASRTALASTVWQTPWRFILKGSQFKSAAFSPDGTRIATGSTDGVILWSAAFGKKISELACRRDNFPVDSLSLLSVGFSPDGEHLVAGSDEGPVCVWDLSTAKEILLLQGHQGHVNSAVFSPDGKRILTASDDGTTRLWNAASGEQMLVVEDKPPGEEDFPAPPVRFAAFSPDGTRIAIQSPTAASIWDTAAGKKIMTLAWDARGASVAFSPDGKSIATTSMDATVRLWNAETGAPISVLRGHEGEVLSAAFSADGKRIVSASWDKTARIWDVASATEIAVLRGHESWVWSAEFSSDGKRIVTSSGDQSVRVWNAEPDEPIAVLNGHSDDVLSAAYSPNGSRIVTASKDKTAQIWNLGSGGNLSYGILRGHNDAVNSASYSPDATRIVTASSDNTARIWDATTALELKVLRGHSGPVNSAAFSPDGTRIATASDDQTARIWDAVTGKQLQIIAVPSKVFSAVFSPDGKRILTAAGTRKTSFDGAGAIIWDVVSGAPIAIISRLGISVSSAVFSSDGSRIATVSEGDATIWNAESGREIVTLHGDIRLFVNSVAFSPDGTRLITASEDGTLRIWDSTNGREIGSRKFNAGINSATFSPDGNDVVIAASKGNTAAVWDIHFATMSAKGLVAEVCTALLGQTGLNRDEMRLAGYPDSTDHVVICPATN
jgi:WD40 repeat protein